MTKALRVIVNGRGLDLMNAFHGATNAIWRELIVQTCDVVKGGLGPFKTGANLGELEKMNGVAKDSPNDVVLEALSELDEKKVIDGLTALVFLALRMEGDRVTYAEVSESLSFFEVLGMVGAVAEQLAEQEETPDPTTARTDSDPGVASAPLKDTSTSTT